MFTVHLNNLTSVSIRQGQWILTTLRFVVSSMVWMTRSLCLKRICSITSARIEPNFWHKKGETEREVVRSLKLKAAARNLFWLILAAPVDERMDEHHSLLSKRLSSCESVRRKKLFFFLKRNMYLFSGYARKITII